VQTFIKLRAVVYELSCSQSFDDAENNTAVASAGSNNSESYKRILIKFVEGLGVTEGVNER